MGCMGDFASNLVANLVGTFVGAGLAILSAWWLERRRTASRERRKLQALIDHLYGIRAIAPNRSRADGPLRDAEREDKERCARSILATRDRIAAVRDDITVHTKAIPILDTMFSRCLTYLNAADDPPEGYVEELMGLRASLVGDLGQLTGVLPALTGREPGTAQGP